MTFDEVIKEIKNNDDFGEDCGSTLDLIGSIVRLKQEYAPTIEMTKRQYEVWNVSLERSKKHKGDFIYFIDVLDDESLSQDNVFRKKLEYFINDSKPLMYAWLYPETIKIVDE